MALNAHLRLVATQQGPVLGSVLQKGREGTVMVLAASHTIVGPRDPASGRPTGKRMHMPFVITKEVDRSSPLLYAILCTNENVTSVEIMFYTPDRTGVERQHYTVSLTNANISSIDFRMPNTNNPHTARLPAREEISFTYQKITWTWMEGNVTAADDWETPRF
ncbi:type VI secretion system tube protein TssD [Chondromyces apiculatus]|uniref:Hcp protein n=1 Tax=Chondromyces apiculatus DSM 436 TaxID=1192034 RepID=A0A017TEU8_9BACT|nr:type VI secretion system tube protein TssD [Chondromyces apiculatus]EYF07096.1 hcp protein [Chondromyces apiculatus DSM 436]